MKRSLAILILVLGSAAGPSRAVGDDRLFELKDGDRVALVGATLIERDRHYGELEAALRSRFPGRKLSFRNMAWPGDTTTVQLRPLNFGSLEQHLEAQKPTVILVSYGSNEAFEGEAGLEKFIGGYSSILDLLAKTGARVIVVSPLRQENLGAPLPDPAEVNRNLTIYTSAIARLAQERNLPFVDLFQSLVDSSPNPPAYPLTENGVHLTDYGYWKAAGVLARELGLHDAPWSIEIDARGAAPRSNASGVRVSDLKKEGESLSFHATDAQVPVPPPEGAPPDAWEGESARVIRVAGLSNGRYALRIDGKEVAAGTSEEWAAGVPIRSGPQFTQGALLRREIVWKNLLFFNRWRAHNGEYIYGRRSTTSEGYDRTKDGGNSGNPSFPGEMAEFERLIEQSDRKADELARPQTHAYELVYRDAK